MFKSLVFALLAAFNTAGHAADSLTSISSGVAGISTTASQGGGYWGMSVSAAVPLTVNTHAVTQGSPWTVSGSVGITFFPGAYIGVSQVATMYYNSVSNNSSVQLTPTAMFTGAIESAFHQPAVQVMVFSDQPFIVYVDQFDGANNLVSTDSFTKTGVQDMNENIMVSGDAVRVRVQNTGASTTTTLRIETTYGPLPPLPRSITSLGNNKNAIMEINGTAVSLRNGAGDGGSQRFALATAYASRLTYTCTASLNSRLVQTGASVLVGGWASNTNGAHQTLKLYDKATAPDIGTDVPVLTVDIPANGGLMQFANQTNPMPFTLGLGFGTTANVADSDGTSISASTLKVILLYR